MKQLNRMHRVLTFGVIAILVLGIAVAQEITPIEPLSLADKPVVVEFSTGAAGPPTIESTTDERLIFRITAAGEVTGDLVGSITAQISEAHSNPNFHPVTIMFSIETDAGVMEGYYVGNLFLAEGSDVAEISGSGSILSVSGAYADLYLADIFVASGVQYVDGRSVGESGTMTIVAR